MENYCDLTDIMVEDEFVPVQFLVPANGVGLLDPSSYDNNSSEACLSWLAQDLRDAVSINLPSCLNQRVRREVQADPGCVNLRRRCYYFYELGVKLIPLISDPALGPFLFYTFRGRYKDILCKAHWANISRNTIQLLTNLEVQSLYYGLCGSDGTKIDFSFQALAHTWHEITSCRCVGSETQIQHPLLVD